MFSKKNRNKKNESKLGLIKLIKYLYRNNFCPLIVFAFSKRECESNALDLYKFNPLQRNKYDAKNFNLNNNDESENLIDLTTKEEEKEKIETIYYNSIHKYPKRTRNYQI